MVNRRVRHMKSHHQQIKSASNMPNQTIPLDAVLFQSRDRFLFIISRSRVPPFATPKSKVEYREGNFGGISEKKEIKCHSNRMQIFLNLSLFQSHYKQIGNNCNAIACDYEILVFQFWLRCDGMRWRRRLCKKSEWRGADHLGINVNELGALVNGCDMSSLCNAFRGHSNHINWCEMGEVVLLPLSNR